MFHREPPQQRQHATGQQCALTCASAFLVLREMKLKCARNVVQMWEQCVSQLETACHRPSHHNLRPRAIALRVPPTTSTSTRPAIGGFERPRPVVRCFATPIRSRDVCVSVPLSSYCVHTQQTALSLARSHVRNGTHAKVWLCYHRQGRQPQDLYNVRSFPVQGLLYGFAP